jgi:hypothetical protein
MKKPFLIICLVFLHFINHAQNVHIPDTNFKKYLIGNKKITLMEIKKYKLKKLYYLMEKLIVPINLLKI